ncbi:MAG: sulfatase [Verrucomicrobiota bacterium]
MAPLIRTLTFSFLLTATVSVFAADKPNILWLIAEDMGPALSCYGNRDITTPNIDRLASEGVRYTRAYTTAPVCSASRSAFMTGMYQTTIGAQNHRSHRGDGFTLPDGVKLIPHWLQQAGYFSTNLTALPESLGFKGTGKTDWNFESADLGFQPARWEELKSKGPFLAQINFHETHRAYIGEHQVDPQKVTIPPYYPDHPVTRKDWASYLDDVLSLDKKVGLILKELETSGLADDTIVLFMADHGESHVRGKQFVYEEGLHIPLIIRWPKNFPAPKQITAGKVDDQLIEAIDLAPTMLRVAGLSKPAKMQGHNFLGEDAEAPRAFAFGARDRCDETVFRLRSVRDERYRYIHNFTPERPFLQANAYKERSYPVWNLLKELHAEGKLTPAQEVLCQPNMPEEELYDLSTDPHQIHNLVNSKEPEAQVALVKLRKALDQWIEETNDQGRVFESAELIQQQTAPKAKKH